MLIANLRSRVFDALQRGIKQDSLRRQLNRENISTAGQNLGRVWNNAIRERDVAKAIGYVRNPLAHLREDTTMAAKLMKHPFQYEYVVNLDVTDAAGNQFTKPINIKSDSNLNMEEQLERAELEGQRLAGFGESDLQNVRTITATKTLVAYYSAG